MAEYLSSGDTDVVLIDEEGLEVIEESKDTQLITEAVQGPRGIQGLKGDTGDKGDKGDKGDTGEQGIPGSAAGTTYDHLQSIASDVWTINHMLGRIPKVTVIDSSGDEVEGSYSYPSLNQVVLTFSSPFGGTAYLS